MHTHTYHTDKHTPHTQNEKKKDKDEISFFFPSEIFSAHSLQEQFKLLLLTKFPRNGGENGMETMVRKVLALMLASLFSTKHLAQ